MEDLDVMHYQPKDSRHEEVFPSNRPHVEHQGFWKEDTVLKNRRLVAQFVMTRATSSRCEKALSGAARGKKTSGMTLPRETLCSCARKLLRYWLSSMSLRMRRTRLWLQREEKRCVSQWCEAPQEEPHNASPRPTSCMLLEKGSHKAWRKTAST